METTEYKPTYEQLKVAVDAAHYGLSWIATHNEIDRIDQAKQLLEEIKSITAPPPPTYEEVTVERWECDKCFNIYANPHGECPHCNVPALWTKLTGTRRVPVKQPVRRSVQAEISHNGEGLNVDDLTVFPPDGTPVTISWEE